MRNIPGTASEVQAPISTCSGCRVSELCLPFGLDSEGTRRLESLMLPRTRVKKGTTLFCQGASLETLYAVRAGFFKTTMTTQVGRDYISGFHMQGEMLGLDAVTAERHFCNAIALEDSVVCGINFSQLEQLSQEFPALQRNMNKLMSQEVVNSRSILFMMGSMSSDERLGAFLLNLSYRYGIRGYSPYFFALRMRREEIASHLGLRKETICRSVSRLRELSLIHVSGRDVEILNLPKLKHHVAGCNRPCP